MAEKKRRVIQEMRILELSAVDNPAQEGAKFVIAKAQKDGDMEYANGTTYKCPDCGTMSSQPGKCKKCGATMKPDNDGDMTDLNSGTDGGKRDFTQDERDHAAHTGAAMPDGSFPIETKEDLANAIHAWGRANPDKRAAVARHIARRARALGLTDMLPTEGELATAAGTSGGKKFYATYTGDDMTEAEKLAKAEQDLADEKAKTEVLAKMVDMSDAEKAHYAALVELDAEGAKKFMDMEKAAREVEIEKAKTADPVIYTDSEGHEYHKSEARAASLAKRADDLAKKNRELEDAQASAEFEKRAAEYPHLKGETAAKVALLKAVESIADAEVKKAVMEMLKANDAGLADAMKELGTKAGATTSEPEAKLTKMAEEKAKAENISFAKAYDLVVQSPEGDKLYKEFIESKQRKAA